MTEDLPIADLLAAAGFTGEAAEQARRVLEQAVPRTEIDAAAALALRGEALTPARVREAGASEYRPAYVAALLRGADGDPQVRVSGDPTASG